MPFFSARWSTCTQSCSGGESIGDLAGAVGRAVVDDEHAPALGRGAAQRLAGGGDDRLDVLGLVVCGQDQPGLVGHGLAYPRAVDLPNAAIADALEELGDLYELDGAIVHRVLAYRNAAKAVREASVSVAALARAGRATELAGIGATLQQKIVTLLDTGTTPSTERMRAQFPPGLIAITRLPGLGPKRARLLFTELGIDSPEKLREAALAQRLRTVRGLGAKFEEGVLAGLDRIAAEPPERATRTAAPAAGARAGRDARRGPARAGRRGHARAGRGIGAADGRQREGHRPDRDHEQADDAREEPRAAAGDRARLLRRQARRQGAHPLGHLRRPADRQARAARQPAPALHRLRARTTRRCGKQRCAAACTCPSTACSPTDGQAEHLHFRRSSCMGCSTSTTSRPSCASTAASWRRPPPGSCRS